VEMLRNTKRVGIKLVCFDFWLFVEGGRGSSAIRRKTIYHTWKGQRGRHVFSILFSIYPCLTVNEIDRVNIKTVFNRKLGRVRFRTRVARHDTIIYYYACT